MNAGSDHLDRPLRTLEMCGLYRRTIRLRCPTCDRVRLLDAIPLWWLAERRRWPDEVRDVIGKFFCEPCFARHGERVRPDFTIVRDRPEGSQLAYPDERVWKRVIARFRS